jgi:energy-coupling factor transport system ATP-binding protein
VSWRVGEGAFALVAGPSGCGKSTLLRCLNGLVPHLSGGQVAGEILVDGHDTLRYGPRVMSRVTGFVFQDPEAQAVAASVEDEIAFSLEQLGVARPIMRTRVEEMLDLLGLAQLRRRAIATLSGGERQRVAIAAAMAAHPRVLVLDEPLSQLDPSGADEVVSALDRLNTDLGVTIVIAEHRLDRLLPRATQLVWVEDGRIGADGSIGQVLGLLNEVYLPPLVALGRRLALEPLPTTAREMKSRLAGWSPGWRMPLPASTASRTLVRLDQVSVRREGRLVLNKVDLTAGSGDVVAIMGRNGSGKTTLLRTVFGFEQPEYGRVETSGLDMSRHKPVELGRRAAYLPQRSGAMLFNESVRAEIEFTRRHRSSLTNDDWLIDALDIGETLDRDPRDLSEGQRLRAALTASLAGAPDVVVLDEPTRGMDGEQKARLQSLLLGLRARGACVLLATHDTELAAHVATRVVLLGEGEIVADGPPHEVLAESLTFSTQIARLFGGGFLTIDDIDPDSLKPIGDTSVRQMIPVVE